MARALVALVGRQQFSLQEIYFSTGQHDQSDKQNCAAGGKQAQVGIVHNFLQYTPRSPDGWSSYYISPVCKLMGKIWSNEALVEYFTKGVFNWDPPFGKSIQLVEDEKPGCDFIGINYYGRQELLLSCAFLLLIGHNAYH